MILNYYVIFRINYYTKTEQLTFLKDLEEILKINKVQHIKHLNTESRGIVINGIIEFAIRNEIQQP